MDYRVTTYEVSKKAELIYGVGCLIIDDYKSIQRIDYTEYDLIYVAKNSRKIKVTLKKMHI
jgi:hypothetical protein